MTEPNAIRITVEVPYLSDEQRRTIDQVVADAVDDWVIEYPERDWDVFVTSHLYHDDCFSPGKFEG